MKKTISFILLFLNIGLVLSAQTPTKMKLDSVSDEGYAHSIFKYDERGNLTYYYYPGDTSIYTYDANDNVLSYTYIGGANRYRYEYTYDNNRNVLSIIRLNRNSGQWVGDAKTENTYNENNKLIDQIYYKYEGDWQASGKQTHYYNSSNYLIKIIRYKFENSSWNYKTNSSYIYDNNNNLTLVLDSTSNYPSSKAEYTYDDRDNNLSQTNFERSGEGFKYKNKVEYTYDENNNTLSSIASLFYENDWLETTRTEYTYDENNNCTSLTKPTRKEEWTYDSNSNCLTVTSSDKEQEETDWIYQVRHSYTYDENNNKIIDLMTQFYDNQWNNNSKNEFIYDYSYNKEDLILPLDYFKMNNMLTIIKGASWHNHNWDTPYFSYYHYSPNSSISLNEISINNTIKVYPNPAQDYISFQLENNDIYSVELYNSNGICVLNTKIRSNNKVDISFLNRGVYFYKITLKSTEKISGKIIKL